jgi:hypothetical protein
MKKRPYRASIYTSALLCSLLLVLVACSGQPGTGSGGGTATPSAGGNAPTPTATQPSAQTVPMPPTQTSCPAANMARAAVMRPLALGTDQNLVYIYNDVPQYTSTASGILRRYDATTGKKTDIVTSGLQILQAQVSADGQWVLFLSRPDPRGGLVNTVQLQLVRMDGQGLQTLMCLPYGDGVDGLPSNPVINFQWSVDEKSILISTDMMDTTTHEVTSAITLLDVSTGTLKPLFLDQADGLYSYSVVTWLDNTHAYIVKQGIQGPTPPETVFLINTTTATVTQPGLVTILTSPTRFSNNSLDSSYDGTQLYSSYCLQAANPFNTNIQAGPAMGGVRHTIWQEQPADCVKVLRAVTPTTLLLVVSVSNATGNSAQMWAMSLPGDSMRSLTTLTTGTSDKSYDLNETSQFPWSNVSRNGSTYTLQEVDSGANTQSILLAPLGGGNPVTIATTDPGYSTVSLAGWTTM